MKYARIINSTAVDIATDPASQFHPILAAEFVEVPDTVEQGWVVDETGNWSAPLPPAEPEPTPALLTPLVFESHLQKASGLSDEQFMAMLNDPALELSWRRLNLLLQIDKDNDITTSALSKMVAAGHLTEEQVKTVNDTWPTE
jgi:hypothetical protein